MVDTHSQKLSTTRLAKKAGIDSRLLFERLIERQWLTREKGNDGKHHYQLTAKGEFEGGEYLQSDKFGRYIVWPQSLLQHRLLATLEAKQLSATALAKPVGAPARLVNLLLAELGWIEAVASGWQLTPTGHSLGGVKKETEQGVTYVSWPQAIEQRSDWLAAIAQLDPDNSDCRSLDGRLCRNPGERLIANWCYLHRISYACERVVDAGQIVGDSTAQTVTVDFYLPQSGLIIEFWGYPNGHQSADYLRRKMQRLESLSAAGLVVSEIREQDLAQLDNLLTKALLKLGIRVY